MKRLWIGIIFLILLLVGGIFMTLALSEIHDTLSTDLSAASRAAQQQDWEAAEALSGAARSVWKQYRRLTATFADHEPLEDLDRLFAELDICRELSLEAEYAAVCSHLSKICSAIAESFRIHWWNVL